MILLNMDLLYHVSSCVRQGFFITICNYENQKAIISVLLLLFDGQNRYLSYK